MPDSNATAPVVTPPAANPTDTASKSPAVNTPPATAGSPGAPASAPPVEPAPLSFKDMIIEAWKMSRQNSLNILQFVTILEEVTERYATIEKELSALRSAKAELNEIKKQLAATYLIADEGGTVTSMAVAARIVIEETKAMKIQLENAVKEGAIVQIDAVSKETDIVSFSYKENGGAGYQSVVTLPEGDKTTAIGKKVGDSLFDNNATIDAVYALVEKPKQDASQPTEAQDGQSQISTQTAQTPGNTQPQGSVAPVQAPPAAPAP